MTEQTATDVYEPPELVAVGEFSSDTLGHWLGAIPDPGFGWFMI
jgi:hypothetical protein